MVNPSKWQRATGAEVRQACRRGELSGPTSGLALGYVQANLVILPRDWAFDFLLFCQRNPQACPILEVTDPGDPEARLVAPGSDLRTDLPAYRIWERGECVAEVSEITRWWREDSVAFLLGCSFTFEAALLQAGLRVRHIELGRNVPMFRTNIPCQAAGRFHGPLVVSMRPFPPQHVIRAIQITRRYPRAHGAPVHLGQPAAIGISDLLRPDYGDPVPVEADEIPLFWACGVTPQAALLHARPPLAITHKPGHMFVTDLLDSQLDEAI
ncbi:MAG: putative hydro-lyase [Gemmataceae bacterium]|nr:putative hydro-lyase [Gemmataceae bacterium]